MLARNAHFNLNRLGATVDTYFDDFYGVDYGADERLGLPSDRLSATWHIDSGRVNALARGEESPFAGKRVATIAIPTDWYALLKRDAQRARVEQTRVREEFKRAFADGLVCAGLERGQEESRYVLFEVSSHG
jgi:predicted GNAT superfamily acetyltransferase